jgi:hypothetical protein
MKFVSLLKICKCRKLNKAYGSMAVYLAKESDANVLLNRRLVQVSGEVVFSESFRYPVWT